MLGTFINYSSGKSRETAIQSSLKRNLVVIFRTPKTNKSNIMNTRKDFTQMNNVVQTWNGGTQPTKDIELTDAQLVRIGGALGGADDLLSSLDLPNLPAYSKKIKLLYFSEDTSSSQA